MSFNTNEFEGIDPLFLPNEQTVSQGIAKDLATKALFPGACDSSPSDTLLRAMRLGFATYLLGLAIIKQIEQDPNNTSQHFWMREDFEKGRLNQTDQTGATVVLLQDKLLPVIGDPKPAVIRHTISLPNGPETISISRTINALGANSVRRELTLPMPNLGLFDDPVEVLGWLIAHVKAKRLKLETSSLRMSPGQYFAAPDDWFLAESQPSQVECYQHKAYRSQLAKLGDEIVVPGIDAIPAKFFPS